MAFTFNPTFPWLLYSYPWMPFPRRVAIYLREKGIPQSLVRIVRVSDPGDGNQVVDASFPPRPDGSLPILAIPSESKRPDGKPEEWFYVKQSMAIIHFLEDLCDNGSFGFVAGRGTMRGRDAAETMRIRELMPLAEALTPQWNPVRTFGTNAGTLRLPEAAAEMLRWIRRDLMAIETRFKEEKRDMSLLRKGVNGHVTIADIVLYQFLEFTLDCYAFDATKGSGMEVTDVYGRKVVEEFPRLKEFFEAFRGRECARRVEAEGEWPGEKPKRNMQTWAEGIM